MTNETLTAILANLRDDLDMLLAVNYSTDENGIAGMRERLASAVANVSELATKLAQDEATLNTCVEHKMLFDKYYSPLVDENKTNISNLWVDFRTFLDDFLTYNETQSTVELSEKINLWSPYLSKLRKMLDVLDADDAQNLKNLLENGGTGGAVSEELEAQVSQNTADISALQSQVEKYLTPPDPYYTGKSFTDYPAGTIWQTYDYDERLLNLSSATLITAPTVYFTAEVSSAGKIKQTFNLSATDAVTAIVRTYLNGALLDERNVDMQANQMQVISFELYDCPLNTATKANNIYTTFSYTSSGKTLNLTYQKVEITASNALCINKICPFNAFCFNDTYYLTDCSGGTLKTAQILAQDMHNMDNLTWVDTGIPAVECIMGGTYYFNSDNTFNEDKVYYFRRGLDNLVYAGEISDGISTLQKNLYQLDTVTDHSSSITLITQYTNNTNVYSSSYNPSSKTISNLISRQNDKEGVVYHGAKFYENTPYSILTFAIRQDNQAQNTLGNAINTNRFSILDGINSTLIAYDINNSSVFKTRVYVKHQDKVVMQVVTKNNNNYELLSSTEIGTYDKYFEMPHNDYFAIKNNQLLYYKKSA